MCELIQRGIYWTSHEYNIKKRLEDSLHVCSENIISGLWRKMGFIFVGISCFIVAAVMMLMEIGIKAFVIIFFIVLLLSVRR